MTGRRWGRGWTSGLLAAVALVGAGGVAVALTAADAPPPKGAPLAQRFTGVNIASGGFGHDKIPGRYGFDYFYPNPGEAAPFLAAGMTAVRVPLIWERIQPVPGEALNSEEMARLDASLAALKGFPLIIVDVHNYAGYHGQKLGSPTRPGALLADLWTRLARRYKDNKRIAFGLMNEPFAMPAKTWAGIADQSIKAIRATGARNLILVPGTRWSGAHSWTAGGEDSNAVALAGLRDPAGNMAFEMHQYADVDSSGTHNDCVAPEVAAQRLAAATRWLREQKARGFLGEFGVAPNEQCLAALDAMLDAVDEANDVWLGWTYWAAGAMWGPYPMSVQPDANGPKPQMAVLERHLARVTR